MDKPPSEGRRRVLGGLAAAAATLLGPTRALAGVGDERRLSFLHTHTSQRLDVIFGADGCYLPDGLARVDEFLKDSRTGERHVIDPALLDLLHDLTLLTRTRSPIAVISGYRSPRTNAMLRVASTGVAGGSLHMQGQAIDIRLADVRSSVLRDAARELRRGGVGFYPSSDFVHVDTGRVRYW